MRMKLFVLGIAALVLGSVAWASDLEVVEQAAPAAPASAVAVTPETPAVVGEARVVTEVEVGSSKLEDTSLLSPGEVTLSQKKVMPPPPAIVVTGVSEPTRYTLGPDDVIEVLVRRHPEFSGNYSINAEGKIQYKFVGDIEVKGLTKTEIKERITQVLSKFIISPDVDVTIVEYRSKVIYVIGEVGAPGKYYMKADKISLREAVVQAGLPTLSASMRRTQLIRPDKSGKPKERTVNLYALLYEGKLNLDQDMLPGDVLVVPATVFAKIMRIVSPVAAPVASGDTLRRAATGGI